ncbi:MAG: ABC transporter substrate-binding protein, partial [Pseudomonadota bacterium]
MEGVSVRILYALLIWLAASGIGNATGVAQPGGDNALRIHVDAARSGGAGESGRAIEYGLRVALESLGNTVGGCPVELVLADHRGSSLRSKRHLDRFLEDQRGLAVFSGLHSPPILAHREFINTNGILLLDPWAAAGPITRSALRPNWIYRLSVDDSVAGEALIGVAVDTQQHSRAGLLLEQTGWGDSNLDTMRRALQQRGLEAVSLQRFRWGMGRARAAAIMANFLAAGVDAIFMVANVEEGAHLVSAMADLPAHKRIPIFSHWGITGGQFVELVGAETLNKVELKVLQTRFSFLSPNLSDYARERFNMLTAIVPAIDNYRDLRAVPGFAHAHDLLLLLNEAAQGIDCTAPVTTLRSTIQQ